MLRTLQRVRSGPSMGRSPRTKLLAMVAALALLLPIGIGLGSAITNFFGGGIASDSAAESAPTADLAKAPPAARAKVTHLAKTAVQKVKPRNKRDLQGLLGYLIGHQQ